jgi:Transposase
MDDSELMDRPAGRDLTLNDYSRGRLCNSERLFYIGVARSSPREHKKPSTLNPLMNSPHPYDLVIGLDRSDKKADLCLIDTRTGQRRSEVIATAPEALWEWLAELRQQHPAARVGLCLEQPAVHLIPFLEAYDWITLHPINPVTLQKYREAFVTSRAKDDTKDAEYLADLLLTHHTQLPVWAAEDSATRAIQQLVVHRRAVVDERTGLSNRLIALLKQGGALTQCASRRRRNGMQALPAGGRWPRRSC